MELKISDKQTEIGIIPENWEVLNLGDCCTQIVDGTHFTPKYQPDGIPFFSVENVTLNNFTNTKYISFEEHKKLIQRCKPQRNDILMTRIGSLGETKFIDWDTESSIYVSLVLLRPKNPILGHYLYEYTKTKQFIKDVEKRSLTNATPPKINMGDIKNIPIPVPNNEKEQYAIAAALSDMDELITSLDTLIAKKRTIKQGVMQELLTGNQRLPGFSEEWETYSIGQLYCISGGYSASREQLSSEGYCYLHYGDIHLSNKPYIDIQSEYESTPKLNISLTKISRNSLLLNGDVVFVDASEDDEGASRHIIIVNKNQIPFISGLHTIVLKNKTDKMNYDYQRYCFQTNDIKRQIKYFAVGTKVTGISKTNIEKLIIPIPSISEQGKIANILITMDSEIKSLEQKRDKTKALKQGMMQELLTGHIRLQGG